VQGDQKSTPRETLILTGTEVAIRRIIDPMPFYVLMVDSDHRIVMANDALYNTFGLSPEDVVGAFCPQLIHGSDGPFPGCPVEEACDTNCSVERDLYDDKQDSWTRSGAYVTDLVTVDNKRIFLHIVSDITEKKKADEELAVLHAGLEETVALRTRELEAANEELQRQIAERERAEELIRKLAYYDGLTGLPNRTNFSRLLAKAIKSASRHDRRFAVALLDLDGLKSVNDTMGHDAGDRLLHLVGKRLNEVLRGDDTAARMGGDEFLFIFTEIGKADEIEPIGQRLLSAFEEPFSVLGSELHITASVGGAVYPDDGLDEPTLMKQADMAMYEAKAIGGNRFCRAGSTQLSEHSGS
jgi:diguanylate cyclase (GGDEF)-like protein/PAS domain S-box-containing protein